MVALLTAAWLALGAVEPLGLAVRDATACVARPALERALAERLSTLLAGSHIRVEVDATPNGDGVQLRLRLEGGDLAAPPLLVRELQIARADCPAAPALLTAIIARRLEVLPRQRFAAPPPPAWAIVVDAGGGVALGTGPAATRGDLLVRVGAGHRSRVEISGALRLSLGHPVPVDGGRARLVTASLGPQIGLRLAVGPQVALIPRLAATGGVQIAVGEGFARPGTAVLPFVAFVGGVDVVASPGLSAGVALEFAATQTVLRGDTKRAAHTEPRLRVLLGLGWRFAP